MLIKHSVLVDGICWPIHFPGPLQWVRVTRLGIALYSTLLKTSPFPLSWLFSSKIFYSSYWVIFFRWICEQIAGYAHKFCMCNTEIQQFAESWTEHPEYICNKPGVLFYQGSVGLTLRLQECLNAMPSNKYGNATTKILGFMRLCHGTNSCD